MKAQMGQPMTTLSYLQQGRFISEDGRLTAMEELGQAFLGEGSDGLELDEVSAQVPGNFLRGEAGITF